MRALDPACPGPRRLQELAKFEQLVRHLQHLQRTSLDPKKIKAQLALLGAKDLPERCEGQRASAFLPR